MDVDHLKVPLAQFSIPACASAFTRVVGAKNLVRDQYWKKLFVVMLERVPVHLQGV